MASSNGHIDVVKLLLEHGADVKAIGMSLRHFSSSFHSQLKVDESNNTALHMASSNGHTNVVKLLLEHGADVKATSMSLRHLSSPFHSQLEGR
jgi:ankyrin repeat protein